jgi:hypothetical protein
LCCPTKIETLQFCVVQQNLVGQHKIWSDDTKFGRTTQNLVGRHKIWSDNTKFGRTTQNCHVVRHKTVMSYDTKLSCRTTKNVFHVNRPLSACHSAVRNKSCHVTSACDLHLQPQNGEACLPVKQLLEIDPCRGRGQTCADQKEASFRMVNQLGVGQTLRQIAA